MFPVPSDICDRCPDTKSIKQRLRSLQMKNLESANLASSMGIFGNPSANDLDTTPVGVLGERLEQERLKSVG